MFTYRSLTDTWHFQLAKKNRVAALVADRRDRLRQRFEVAKAPAQSSAASMAPAQNGARPPADDRAVQVRLFVPPQRFTVILLRTVSAPRVPWANFVT